MVSRAAEGKEHRSSGVVRRVRGRAIRTATWICPSCGEANDDEIREGSEEESREVGDNDCAVGGRAVT